jgi:hypothetical protein
LGVVIVLYFTRHCPCKKELQSGPVRSIKEIAKRVHAIQERKEVAALLKDVKSLLGEMDEIV